MADVYNYVTLTGTIETDTSVIQTEVQGEFQTAFGTDLSLESSTPQGLLISDETLARSAVADNNVAVANQINPNIAGGIYLDALAALTAAQRAPVGYSQVIGSLTGVSGTIVPIGSQALDLNGNLWETIVSVTILGGTAATIFQSVAPGGITIAIASLTSIVSTVLGWETVTNAAVQYQLGSDAQSDAAFRNYRLNTLAGQGTALPLATLAGLYTAVSLGGAGCTSVSFLENLSNVTAVVKKHPSDPTGVTMTGHSIYICAAGGSNLDIANVLTSKKGGGCGYSNGASMTPIAQPITVPYSGQVLTVLFDRPDPVPIQVQVKISANTSIPNPTQVVKAAIEAYAAGQIPGENGLGIGDSVSGFEFAGAITTYSPGIFVLDVQIATIPGTLGYATIPITVWQQANVTDSSITVIIV